MTLVFCCRFNISPPGLRKTNGRNDNRRPQAGGGANCKAESSINQNLEDRLRLNVRGSPRLVLR